MDSYQRNGSPETSVWKTDVDNFQGYVRAKLEDVVKDQEDTQKRVRTLEKNGQYQAGGIVAITTIIGIIIAAYSAGLIPLGGI